MDDNQRQVVRDEETVVAGQPERTTVRETAASTSEGVMVTPGATMAPMAASEDRVRTTTASATPSNQTVSRNVAERVVDPVAEMAAGIGWFNNFIWFIVGLLSILLLIRFILLAAGANEATGF